MHIFSERGQVTCQGRHSYLGGYLGAPALLWDPPCWYPSILPWFRVSRRRAHHWCTQAHHSCPCSHAPCHTAGCHGCRSHQSTGTRQAGMWPQLGKTEHVLILLRERGRRKNPHFWRSNFPTALQEYNAVVQMTETTNIWNIDDMKPCDKRHYN